MTSRTGTDGFTLIEVVLVSVLVSLLLLATIPRFQRTAQRLRLERSVFELAQLLRSAHAQAVSEGSEHVLVWEDESRRAHLEKVPEEGAPVRLEGRAAASAPLLEGAVVEIAQDGSRVACECVRFFPDGTSDPATVTVQLDERIYRMMIDGTTSQVAVAAGPAAR